MKNYFHSLFTRTWLTFWELAKVMVPVMIIVKIAKDLGAIQHISPLIEPLTYLMGLPPEAGLVWAAAMLTNLYGGIAAMAVLAGVEMSVAQVSILCTAILFAHALPVEQAIVKRTGVSFWFTTVLRIGVAVLYGIIVSWLCRVTGFLSETANTASFKHLAQENSGYIDWAISSGVSLLTIITIILALYILLDVLEKTGITNILLKALAPLLRFSGLTEQTTPITTIGVLLGISYGSGLIIQKVREENIEPRALFLSMSWICLSHSLIEDTALMIAVGGDIWIVLVGRVIITLFIIKALAMVLYSQAWARRFG